VGPCYQGEAVCPDLVRRVSVCGNAVGTYQNGVDLAIAMTAAAMLSQIRVTGIPAAMSSKAVIRDPCKRGLVFIGVHVEYFAFFLSHINCRQRGPIFSSG